MNKKSSFFAVLIFATFLSLFTINSSNEAYATSCKPPECGCCAGIVGLCYEKCSCVSREETGQKEIKTTTIGHVTHEFNRHRSWMVERFFLDDKKDDHPGLLAAMKVMTSQLTAIGIQQVEIIGTFFDAKHQLETQRIFQQKTAEAHKDYHPSEELCDFGSVSRSLSASSRNSDLAATAISKRSIDRQLMAKSMTGAGGEESDEVSRLVQFVKRYCSKKDNAKGLELLCMKSENQKHLFNKDVNYTTTVESPLTLNIDFTAEGNKNRDKKDKEDEYALFALTANLFSHELLPLVVANTMVIKSSNSKKNGEATTAAKQDYLDARALIAKRSVASNSLASVAALKAKGDKESKPFVYALLKEMGGDQMDETKIAEYIGKEPSYFAQMEILTKKLFQTPSFYAGLHGKPANVMRQDVTLQAITLMQKRDLYRSYLRSEMILAVMLEAALDKEQQRVTNELNPAKEGEAFEIKGGYGG